MKKLLFATMLCFPFLMNAQIGIKGGVNFAKVANASQITAGNQSGFHAGIFFGASTKKILGFRSELSFSRQGYNFKTSETTGNVRLDYFLQTQLMCVNITKFAQLQFGFQTAFLLNANVDSAKKSPTNATSSIMELYNKFDYGYAIGAEIHPFKGLLVGARYNVSLAKIYKDLSTMQAPSFTSEDAKNNVIMLFVGWNFGSKKQKSLTQQH